MTLFPDRIVVFDLGLFTIHISYKDGYADVLVRTFLTEPLRDSRITYEYREMDDDVYYEHRRDELALNFANDESIAEQYAEVSARGEDGGEGFFFVELDELGRRILSTRGFVLRVPADRARALEEKLSRAFPPKGVIE